MPNTELCHHAMFGNCFSSERTPNVQPIPLHRNSHSSSPIWWENGAATANHFDFFLSIFSAARHIPSFSWTQKLFKRLWLVCCADALLEFWRVFGSTASEHLRNVQCMVRGGGGGGRRRRRRCWNIIIFNYLVVGYKLTLSNWWWLVCVFTVCTVNYLEHAFI